MMREMIAMCEGLLLAPCSFVIGDCLMVEIEQYC